MDAYGPALPPGFKENRDSDSLSCTSDEENPVLKPLDIIGPQLPPELAEKCSVQIDDSDDDDGEVPKASCETAIGPALPPGFTSNQVTDDADSDFDLDSAYGPLPAPDNSESIDDVLACIEKRATNMKKKLEEADMPIDNVAKREEWMTLPATDYKNQFGVISRCLVDDGKPKSSSKRTASKISPDEVHRSVKDDELREELEKYNKAKRAKSLLELHKKSRKHKKDKESKPKERKAFDRDAELGIRMMDQRQVNSVIKNARKLNTRFASGASQYL